MDQYGINIITWNARGIRNKHLELFQFLINHNIHICLVTETGLNSNLSISNSEFKVYRNDRIDRTGGGVAVIIKKNIRHKLLPIANTSLIENIGIKLFTSTGPIDIYSCYYPGGSAGLGGIKKRQFASDIHMLSGNVRYLLGGDFNCRHQSWGCMRGNCWGNILYEKLVSYNIHIIYPCDHTHIPSSANRQGSTLDFFLTNEPIMMSPALVINDLSSDHLPVKISLNSSYNNSNFFTYDFDRTNWSKFSRFLNRNLNLPNFDDILNNEHIDQALVDFRNVLNDAIAHSVPKRYPSTRRKSLPYYVINIIQQRNSYRRNWQRNRNLDDFYQVKILNQRIRDEIDSFRNKSWDYLLSTLDRGSPPFWNLTKVLRKKSNNIPILKHDGNRYTTNQEKCELLARTFASNHSVSAGLGDSFTESLVNDTLGSFQSVIPSEVYLTNTSQISELIRTLGRRKSPGIDGINNRCLRALPNKGIGYLTIIINSCLKLCYFPQEFKESKVIPIKKPGKQADSPYSYRPISLLSSISKLLEKVVKIRLTNFMEANNIIPPQQFGFRREHNTVHPLIRIRNLVKDNFNHHKSTGMVLLDVKAAFDSVWHEGLVFKMIRLNFPVQLTKIILSFLSSRTFKVYIGSYYSERYSITAGCPQGSCLSPVLYNLYTADFPQLDYCTLSIFADDTAVLSSDILATNIIYKLQRALTEILSYFNKWKIMLNSEKTQAIYFTRKRKACYTPQVNICINNISVKWEQKVKYLGIMLDQKMTFKEHIPYIVNKVNVLIRILYPFINRRSSLTIGNKKLILKSIFHAVIFYAVPVWSTSASCHIKRLQITQNKLLKLIYNLPWFFSTHRLHELADIEFVADRVNRLTQKFNSRCLNSDFIHINELASS